MGPGALAAALAGLAAAAPPGGTHALAFYYTSLAQARACAAAGALPAEDRAGGVVVHLRGPHEVRRSHERRRRRHPRGACFWVFEGAARKGGG